MIKHLRIPSLLIAFGLSLGLGLNRASAQNCPISFPNGNTLSSFIEIYPNYPNSDAYFHTEVSAGAPIPAGTYLTWCVDANTFIDPSQGSTVPGTAYTGVLFPNCDSNLNSELPAGHPATCYVESSVWQQVNYILNHKNSAYFWEIQVAINTLVGGPPLGPSPPYPPYNPAVVQALLSDAAANAAAWVPQCGNVVGAIYVVTNQAGALLSVPVQLLMIEVPVCPVSFTLVPTNVALGCNPTNIPDCTNPVNTNLVKAVSCCGRQVTITCNSSTSSIGCKSTRYLTYTATDGLGNTATAAQTITWTTDTTAPVITTVPAGGTNVATLPTDTSIAAGVVATDGCSGLQSTNVTHVDTTTNCVVTRTFTITVKDNCGNASLAKTVKYTSGSPCSGLGHGDTATIGFWHNKNGQALINAQTPATALANWLAGNFPYLYGANAGANNLTGKTDSTVAALFLKFFGASGAKTDAQIMAGALAAYVTDSDLGGNSAAKYGFNVSPTGTGAKTYNVGSYGTAIGLVNNTSYTILQLLQQANLMKKNGTFNANAFNAIFDGINRSGDIN